MWLIRRNELDGSNNIEAPINEETHNYLKHLYQVLRQFIFYEILNHIYVKEPLYYINLSSHLCFVVIRFFS